MNKNIKYILFFIIVFASILLFCCNQLDEILYLPQITPEEWCESQPCMKFVIFSLTITIVQPSSTFFVYLLGFITIAFGVILLKRSNGQKFISWWGIALLLWGVGAILAGTSYQAFSYEIKCANRPFCIWTSLWEIFYLIFSVGSVNAMLLAQSKLRCKSNWGTFMEMYGLGNFILYIFIIVIGSIIPVQFLISFELMILFLAPTILFLLIVNLKSYLNQKELIRLSLVVVWFGLILIIGLYFLYYMVGITELLWEQEIWFSENDVLHISLILWMIYIYFVVNRFGKDSKL